MIQNNEFTQFTESNTETIQPPPYQEMTPEISRRLKDPFDNPTEYHEYREDYSKIVPWLRLPEFKLSFEPARTERKLIKRTYSIGSLCVLLNYLGAQIAALLLIEIIKIIIGAVNPSANSDAISDYMSQTSIMYAINMLVFLLANVGFALLGFKWAKIKPKTMLKPKNFSALYAFQYCIIGLMIWFIAAMISAGVEEIFSKFGHSTIVDMLDDDITTPLGMAVMVLYSCIIAPITEEIFYRGMVLKVFSQANQRFAIIISAVFFGLAHGNLPQFALAFLLGIFLAHITMKHDSIIPSIIVHMCINTTVTLGSEVSEIILISAALISFIAGLVLLPKFRKTDKLPATTPAQTRRGISVALTTVGFDITVVFMVFGMLLILMTN